MPIKSNFNGPLLNTVIGGMSTLDMPRLNIHTAQEASAFLMGYGYDFDNESDLKKLWYFHRRALVFIDEKLKLPVQEIPDILKDPKQLGDLRQLLILASTTKAAERPLQKWACAILRVMHTFVHIENDLFSSFSEEIQKQILTPFQNCIIHDGARGLTLLKDPSGEPTGETITHENNRDLEIILKGFEVKPFKTSTSSVLKLLAKSDALAMSVLDKLGVRFITNRMIDTYRVVQFLIDHNLISFPHIIPDQSSNNIYPVELFLEVSNQLREKKIHFDDHELEDYFLNYLNENLHKAEFLRKENNFSGPDYRFIKFICRKLVKVQLPDNKGEFSFFFPFEVQIMDKISHENILSGPAEHKAYKDRQRLAAQKRVFPEA